MEGGRGREGGGGREAGRQAGGRRQAGRQAWRERYMFILPKIL